MEGKARIIFPILVTAVVVFVASPVGDLHEYRLSRRLPAPLAVGVHRRLAGRRPPLIWRSHWCAAPRSLIVTLIEGGA